MDYKKIKENIMQKWVNCTITVGQFSDEYGVEGRLFNNKPFSLFAPKDYVTFETAPERDKPVKGKIRADVVQEKGDLVLVVLPQQTFENGRAITVKAEQVE